MAGKAGAAREEEEEQALELLEEGVASTASR